MYYKKLLILTAFFSYYQLKTSYNEPTKDKTDFNFVENGPKIIVVSNRNPLTDVEILVDCGHIVKQNVNNKWQFIMKVNAEEKRIILFDQNNLFALIHFNNPIYPRYCKNTHPKSATCFRVFKKDENAKYQQINLEEVLKTKELYLFTEKISLTIFLDNKPILLEEPLEENEEPLEENTTPAQYLKILPKQLSEQTKLPFYARAFRIKDRIPEAWDLPRKNNQASLVLNIKEKTLCQLVFKDIDHPETSELLGIVDLCFDKKLKPSLTCKIPGINIDDFLKKCKFSYDQSLNGLQGVILTSTSSSSDSYNRKGFSIFQKEYIYLFDKVEISCNEEDDCPKARLIGQKIIKEDVRVFMEKYVLFCKKIFVERISNLEYPSHLRKQEDLEFFVASESTTEELNLNKVICFLKRYKLFTDKKEDGFKEFAYLVQYFFKTDTDPKTKETFELFEFFEKHAKLQVIVIS